MIDNSKESVYLRFVQLNNLGQVVAMIGRGVDVNCLDCAAFLACIYLDHFSMLKLLLKHGLKPSLAQLDEGAEVAAKLGHKRMERLAAKLATDRRISAKLRKL
jgi:hypothetical protein